MQYIEAFVLTVTLLGLAAMGVCFMYIGVVLWKRTLKMNAQARQWKLEQQAGK